MISRPVFQQFVVNILGGLVILAMAVIICALANDWTFFKVIGLVTAGFGAMVVLISMCAYACKGVEWLAGKFYDRFINKEIDK